MIYNPNEELDDNANTVIVESVSVPFTENSNNNNNKKEIKMADIVTGTVTGVLDTSTLQRDHADIRREVATEACHLNGSVKDARHDIIQSNDAVGDRMVDRVSELRGNVADRFYAVGQDLADVRAQIIQTISTVKMSTELNALKGIIEGQKNTTYLSDKIQTEGEKTRNLINDMKYHDLNRGLVERNAELVECQNDRRHWRHTAEQNQFQGQWAALQSQIQAFASQLQETRQGVTNFGSMTGNAGRQSSTSNNA
jgi:hypothetical protein